MYDRGSFRPYVSIAERRKRAAKEAPKLNKKGQVVSPVEIGGRTIASTFWGKAWCDHLESFSDYANRLPRGRTYVRNGSVIHLAIGQGKVEALVQGSSLYKVKIGIKETSGQKWKSIIKSCSGEIDSVIELLQGKLSSSVMKTMTDKKNGLFPLPKEITLNCSCPDWADMCKHVAAVLYGVGARLDQDPTLLFRLRHLDHLELVKKVTFKAPVKRSSKSRVVTEKNLSNLFGIEIDTKPTGKLKKSTAKPALKTATKKNRRLKSQ